MVNVRRHFVRRAASRAISASAFPSSFVAKPCSLNTSPFIVRSSQRSALAQSLSKRFYSEEKTFERKEEEAQSSIPEAVESAKEYASEAAHRIQETAGDFAAAARDYAPRGFGGTSGRPERRERKDDRVVQPASSIYVGNLLFDVQSADLEKEFSQFGKVEQARVATDDRGLSKG